MSLAQPSSVQERRPSAPLNLNLPSNNPFRNGAASPGLRSEPSSSPQNPFFKDRPVSRNPFLEALEVDGNRESSPQPPRSPQSPPTAMSGPSSATQKAPATLKTTELLAGLTLTDRPSTAGRRDPLSTGGSTDKQLDRPQRSENMPPPGPRRAPPPPGAHRPTRSREEEARLRNGAPPPYRPARQRDQLDIFADPSDAGRAREPGRRVRRNSDSSVADARSSKLLSPEDERRRAERERRHRERRDREGKHRESGSRSSPKAKKPNQRLDIIDKLDVTSIYGTGLFHHDGPFDACNPHRNRKGSSRAPMQAFPKDSANNAIGGSGPVNKDIDHNLFHGNRGAEAFSDFSRSGTDAAGYSSYSGPARPSTARSQSYTPAVANDPIHGPFNPVARVDPVHGDESLGLGTSTFLEGAPASRIAIKRRESESNHQAAAGEAGGLGRKKSLAQKIRGINAGRQGGRGAAGRVASPTSPEPQFELGPIDGAAAAGPRTLSGTAAARPFSPDSNELPKKISESAIENVDYDEAYEQKGESIATAQRNRALSNPRRALQRAVTHDSASVPSNDEEPVKQSGGILSRMKSLRGGKRARPSERPLA